MTDSKKDQKPWGMISEYMARLPKNVQAAIQMERTVDKALTAKYRDNCLIPIARGQLGLYVRRYIEHEAYPDGNTDEEGRAKLFTAVIEMAPGIQARAFLTAFAVSSLAIDYLFVKNPGDLNQARIDAFNVGFDDREFTLQIQAALEERKFFVELQAYLDINNPFGVAWKEV